MNVLRLWVVRNRFTIFELLFTRIYDQKIAWRSIEIFKRRRSFSKYLYLAIL